MYVCNNTMEQYYGTILWNNTMEQYYGTRNTLKSNLFLSSIKINSNVGAGGWRKKKHCENNATCCQMMGGASPPIIYHLPLPLSRCWVWRLGKHMGNNAT